MSQSSPRLLVTGAAGQLGRLVIAELLKSQPAANVVALVRNRAAAADLAVQGVDVRVGDYDDPAALDRALAGVDRVLLIASNALGVRVRHHGNVVAAAQRAGVQLLAFTSLLHADRSPLTLAAEYRPSEALIRESGIPFVLLRNGWYTENRNAAIAGAMATGAVYGSAGTGRFSTAARHDFAAAAAAVLTTPGHAGRTYELAGDTGHTLAEFAAEIARQSGRAVEYRDLPEAAFRDALVGAGLPADYAAVIADSDTGAAAGALFDDSGDLRTLIGRATTPLADTVAEALRATAAAPAH